MMESGQKSLAEFFIRDQILLTPADPKALKKVNSPAEMLSRECQLLEPILTTAHTHTALL